MRPERGPREKIHFPTYTEGCYYGSLEDCCWFCTVRVATGSFTSPLRYKIRKAETHLDHDLVGEEILIPDFNLESPPVHYTEGRISAVHSIAGAHSDIFTIKTEENNLIHIDLTRHPVGDG